MAAGLIFFDLIYITLAALLYGAAGFAALRAFRVLQAAPLLVALAFAVQEFLLPGDPRSRGESGRLNCWLDIRWTPRGDPACSLLGPRG